MKTFVDAQIKHAPSNVKPRRASRAINPLITCAVIAFVGFLASIACAVPSFAQIVGTVQLSIERRGHTATLLEDGKVLIVGGDNQSGIVNQVELLDPASQTSSLAATPIVARTDHTATRLADGRVLIIGGRDQNGSLTSTEIYNPLTATFTAGPSLTTPRSGHTATVLANGNILVAGGDASGSAELYNSTTQSFSLIAGSMNTARKFQSAILLNNGQVLIAGGVGAQNNVLNTAEVYDPSSQSFYVPPTDMQTPRALAMLKLLSDGKVQIIGGDAELSMEVFDPVTGIFNAKALLPPNANLLGATLSTHSRAALFSPLVLQDPMLQGVLTPEQSALLDRADQSITELPSRNQALVAGGINSAGQILKSANLVKSSSASVTTDKTDYPPGEIVTITGSGFQPNEQVQLSLHEFPEEYPDISFSAIANQQGNFVATDFAPQLIDLDRIFTLTAVGQTSGFTAQTAFKDAVGLQSVSVGVQSPNPVVAGNQTSHPVTVGFNGNGSIGCSATLSVISVLPTGASASFSPNPVASNGSNVSSTLTITTNALTTPSGSSTFTVRATAPSGGGGQGCNGGTVTTSGTLVVQAPAVAPTTLTVSPASGTYGGTVNLSATLTKTIDGSAVSGKSINFSLNGNNVGNATTNGSGVATLSGASLAGINAGTYSMGVGASFTGDSSFASSNGSASLTIAKAATVTTVTCGAGPFTYNGNPHTPCSASVTGPGLNESLAVNYTDNVNAGTATASASYAESANYLGSNDSKNFTIEKAASVTSVTCPASVTYNGAAQTPCTAEVIGVGGLNQVLTVSYTNNINAGTATASASFAGDANHNGSSDSKNFTIEKASSTTTVTFESGPYTYRGTAFTATAGVTGVGGLNQTVAVVYTGDCTNVTVANGCTATATFAGDTNHNGSSDTKSITINKRPITVTADAKTKTYGESDPPLTYQVTSGSLAFSDAFMGALSRVPGELVGTYAIQQGNLALNSNYTLTYSGANLTITTGFAFNGFHSPIGGSVENGGNGGSYANPLKTFKLGSTIPVKFGATWLNGGAALITGIHTLQAVKYSNAIDWDPPIDATPTDAATDGNHFRLTTTDWHFNLSTKGSGFSAGTWLLIATLQDGSKHSVWITIKK
jgi:MBG domain (YGX type)/Galactose oxidase, central domain